MEEERKEFLKGMEFKKCNQLERIADLLKTTSLFEVKDVTYSAKMRREGNALFLKNAHSTKEHEDIFTYYNKSIIFAPTGCESLALAYGNRSAYLLHIEKYEACMQDIDRAVFITKSTILKMKLLLRKAKCLAALKNSLCLEVLDEVQSILDRHGPGEDKIGLLDLVLKTKTSLPILMNSELNTEEETRHAEIMKELAQTDDFSETVEIKSSQKYGNHLVATRDFNPGEIIFVEQFHASCLSLDKMYTNCNYCFATCWSGVPCDKCNMAIFCSDECKKLAMTMYHDFECTVIPSLKKIHQKMLWNYHLGIRLLIMALKEAGTISQLKSELESAEKLRLPSQMLCRKFLQVCKLTSKSSENHALLHALGATDIMVLLAKHTSILGKTIQSIEDMMKNEDFIFLGSLLVKLLKIGEINAHSMSDTDIHNPFEAEKRRGVGLALNASLINHSCIPNIGRAFAQDRQIIVYAIQPIKKGSQIFDTYHGWYHEIPSKKERQENLKHYLFTCDCLACKNNWKPQTDMSYKGKFSTVKKISDGIEKVRSHLAVLSNLPDSGTVKQISQLITQSTECFPPNSDTLVYLYQLLIVVYNRIYNFDENNHKSCGK